MKIVTLDLLVTPIITLFGQKYSYRLLDSAYGEWLNYEDNYPKYYLNIFDDEYREIENEIVQANINIKDYLETHLHKTSPELKMASHLLGIRLSNKEAIVKKSYKSYQ